jgi:hypothetical protein
MNIRRKFHKLLLKLGYSYDIGLGCYQLSKKLKRDTSCVNRFQLCDYDIVLYSDLVVVYVGDSCKWWSDYCFYFENWNLSEEEVIFKELDGEFCHENLKFEDFLDKISPKFLK